jgi:hypothetical protein
VTKSINQQALLKGSAAGVVNCRIDSNYGETSEQLLEILLVNLVETMVELVQTIGRTRMVSLISNVTYVTRLSMNVDTANAVVEISRMSISISGVFTTETTTEHTTQWTT